MSQTLSGNDTVIINNRIISDLADGDAVLLDFPNDIAAAKTGKNKNSIYSDNATGEQCNVTLRVLRGTEDDKYFNALLTQQRANFASFVLMTGEFIKKLGDGKGNVLKDIYVMSGGIFTKRVGAKSNAEGDTEQSVSIYILTFTLAPRALT